MRPGASAPFVEAGTAQRSSKEAGKSIIDTSPERSKSTRVISANMSVWQRLAEIWRSRELLVYLVKTEIKVKYKNSVLGLLWSLVSPAMTLAVFYVVFQYIAKNGIPNFVIFLFSGLLLWNLFQTGVQTATGVVVNNAGIVKKVAFPREILALAAIGSASVFFFFQMIVMVIFMIVLKSPPVWKDLPLLVVALLAMLVLASALAVFLSAINVYLRDAQHLVEVILTALFWMCPIVYSFQLQLASKLVHHGLSVLYLINPVTPLVMTFQKVIYAKEFVHNTSTHGVIQILPPWSALTYLEADIAVLVFGAVLFLVALMIFGRLEGNFAEEL